jgi:hypothetical protein
MELVVKEAALEEFFRSRRAHKAAGHAHPAEADIVEQDEKDVGRAFGCLLIRGEVGRRLRRIHLDFRVRELRFRLRQVIAVEVHGIAGALSSAIA